MPQPEALLQTELATRLGITTRAVRKLHDHGIPRDEQTSRYPWPDARDWYIKFKQEEVDRRRGAGSALDFQVERARKTAVQADREELKLAQERREMVHMDDVAELVRAPLERVDGALKNAPARHAGDLAEAAGIPAASAKRLLETVIEAIRGDLRRAHEGIGADGR